MAAPTIGRRELLRRASLGALAAISLPALASCGDPRESDHLSFLNWQDYIEPNLTSDFERRTGISVTYETYATNDELALRLAQAQRPRPGGRTGSSFDLIVPSDNFVTRFRDEDALLELDHSAIAGLDNLGDSFRRAAFDPGNRFSVPWATGTTGIGYDTTVFSEPPGYDVFLDPTYAGRTTVLAEIRDALGMALLQLGEDPNTRDPAQIDDAADLLIQMKAVVRGFESSYLSGLARGDLVAAHAYSSDVLQAREQNPDLGFALPDAGALRWVDSLAVPVDAPRPENAFRFVSFYLEPEVSASNAAAVKVDTGNEAARRFLPQDILDDPVIFPPADVLDRLVFTADLGEDEQLYEDAWGRVQSA
jgi:spermidine/putrescine transport system substrate-binding protein